MENQNILVCFSVVHVLLNIYTSTCQGKVFSREINHNDQTIVIDIRDHFIDVLNSRKRRDLSDVKFGSRPEISGSQNMSALTSSVFKIPDRLHSQAVVHWSGKDGKASIISFTEKYVTTSTFLDWVHIILILEFILNN